MKILTQTLKRHRVRFGGFAIIYAALTLIVSVCGVATTKLTGDLSQAALAFDVNVFLRFLLVMAGVTAIETIASALRAFLRERYDGRVRYKLRAGFAGFFTRLRFNELTKKNSGEMLSVYSNDLPMAASYISESVLSLGAEVLNVVVVFIYMATVQPVYTLIFFLMFPLLVVMQSLISSPIQKKQMTMSEERARFNAVVNDSLQNIPTVVAYSLEDAMEKRYLDAYDKFFSALRSYVNSLLSLVMSGMLATMLPILFVYVAAGNSVLNGNLTFGEFIAFTMIATMAVEWLGMLSQQLVGLRRNAASAKKLAESMDGAEENLNVENHTAGVGGAITLNNVAFSYNADAKALDGVSLSVKEGARVAIVGPSGSGKSTVLKLLLGLYEPDAGEISVSGNRINANADKPDGIETLKRIKTNKEISTVNDGSTISLKQLRSRIAYVPQDSFMFPETIRANLSDKATEAELRRACEHAGILKFIDAQPQGFDTILSESSENISGGQRQRLAIARAYLQNAPVVLFDEATAALDPLTEADVLKAFIETTEGKTVLMVAHRPAAIKACERVVMLDGGKIAADGTHECLLKESPAYAELYRHMEEDAETAQNAVHPADTRLTPALNSTDEEARHA